jgi:hypothetical protein
MDLFGNRRRGINIPRLAAFAVAVLAAAPALATDTSTKDSGEHGSAGPSSPASSSGPSSSTEAGQPEANEERNLGSGAPFSLTKRFEFEAGWELHGMLVQNNLVGNGSETVFEYFYAGASYYITPNDKLRLIMGLYQFALADPGETGWRADDLLLRYNHHVFLPWKLGLDLSGSLTAPFSFESAKMGLITEPQVRVGINRTFFKYITVDFRVFFDYYWQTFTTMQGGSTPNPTTRTGGILSVEAELPWHRALALGIDLETAYNTYYNPAGQPGNETGIPSASGLGPYYGVTTNSNSTSQPIQQDYGMDIYVSYTFPRFYGLRPIVEVAYAQGDPTAGFTSDLIDGVNNLYLFYPEASQVFASVSLKY